MGMCLYRLKAIRPSLGDTLSVASGTARTLMRAGVQPEVHWTSGCRTSGSSSQTSFRFSNALQRRALLNLERAMGIEPTSKAWEAFVLPLNYARRHLDFTPNANAVRVRYRVIQAALPQAVSIFR